MEHDFSVDPTALTRVATAIEDAVTTVRAHGPGDQVGDCLTGIDCRPETIGHDQLAAALRGFCDRWEPGLAHLSTDGLELADGLTQTAATYDQAERGAHQALRHAQLGPVEPTTPGSEVVS